MMPRDDRSRVGVVADDGEGATQRRAGGHAVVLHLVVAEVVERLHDAGERVARRVDLARRCAGRRRSRRCGRRPAASSSWRRRRCGRRSRSHGTVPALPNGTATMMTSASATRSARAGRRVRRGRRRHEQVERGLARGTRDEHVVSGCHEESGEGGAHLARTEDPDDRPFRHVHASILANAHDRCVDIIRQRTRYAGVHSPASRAGIRSPGGLARAGIVSADGGCDEHAYAWRREEGERRWLSATNSDSTPSAT